LGARLGSEYDYSEIQHQQEEQRKEETTKRYFQLRYSIVVYFYPDVVLGA
jgi:hypothetical protein